MNEVSLIDAEALKKALHNFFDGKVIDEPTYILRDVFCCIDNAPAVKPQKIVTIPPELIEKLASCVVNTIEKIDWDKAIEAYKERSQGETNAEIFQQTFGIYATELWSMKEADFLKWLNAEQD